jgi:hypothetical protein
LRVAANKEFGVLARRRAESLAACHEASITRAGSELGKSIMADNA